MPLSLVLTNDWELFGDGSGDYFELQHQPLMELLPILKSFNAKITLMAEVGQQFAFISKQNENQMFKDLADAWEDAVRTTVKSGSDVQLHLHPQWLDASYSENTWHLNMDYWAISSLDSISIEDLIKRGKDYLESLIIPVKNDYRCVVFRAGAYCIQPEKAILENLIKLGFIADSSVTKGWKADNYYDFTDAFSDVLPWMADINNINHKSELLKSILEIPIHSFDEWESPGLKKFFPEFYYKFFSKSAADEINWQQERVRVKDKRYPVKNRFYKKYQQKGLKFYLSAILSKKTVQLDYDYLTPSEFIKALKNISKRKVIAEKLENGETVSVVASGHMKDMHNTDNIKNILMKAEKEFGDRIIYETMSEAAGRTISLF